MKYRIETEEYPDTHTVDGVTAPVARTRRIAVPVLPRDWDALAVRAVVGLVLALTLVSITWSTVSIAHLLDGTWTAYLAASVFDLAWCAALGMAYLVRFRPDRRKVVDRVGWALLAVTVTAIGLEGYQSGGIAMACIGASVSIAAKALWWTLGHATRPELTADDAQWVAAQISNASAQLAVASVRRQVARAQDRAAAELLAMEASRRPPFGTVLAADGAAPAALPTADPPAGSVAASGAAPAVALDAAPAAAVERLDGVVGSAALGAVGSTDEALPRTGGELVEQATAPQPTSRPAKQPASRPAVRPNRGVPVPRAARATQAAARTDAELLAALDALGDAAAGLSVRGAAAYLAIGETRAKRLLAEHATRRHPLSLVKTEAAS
ncbi:hypothetical protein CC117_00740 [Parafrankia colletiae]|uniref:Uncharacterized protein n=1 Tax=Parafrankia colletiae TaxID=573497 RepID=A0A1S1RJA1_9ACTN|nr:hypothetical protein [Parafrankia colletiae]MCK9904278.1 hypothetical protein [Frankia sp. Cpl3]OHV46216.1 hypothetical protein CC117_00740 [Parafrankia colletiae]